MKLILLIRIRKMTKILKFPFLLAKKIMFLFYLYSKTNFEGLVKDENCDIIVWTPKFNWKYFYSERLLTDLAYINSLSNKGVKFRRVKALDIGNYWGKTIYLPYDKYDKTFGLVDYTKQLFLIISELKKQNNVVYPKFNEYLLWENKAYMHEKFEVLKIPHPNTRIFHSFDDMVPLKPDFPFLIKEVHSCSANGVYKINNEADLISIRKSLTGTTFLVQQLLNMRRDLRVTIVGDKIVHFYWRINNANEWKPTSTGHGSSVDFVNFPEKWRVFIIEQFLKLKIVTGAFDIAWENDDLNNIPLILEISPTYQLNPVTTNSKYLQAYGEYKKYSYFGKDSYTNQYIAQTFDVIDKIVEQRLNNKN
mgnify:FL=1|jgi:hypothetical protein